MIKKSKFNRYTMQARIAPVVIVLLPIFMFLGYLLYETSSALALKIVSSFGLFFFYSCASYIGRIKGKEIETKLIVEWDGFPSIRYLRHRSKEFNALRREKIIKTCFSYCVEAKPPSLVEELESPVAADVVYEVYNTFLKRHSNRSRNPAVFNANVDYGFTRNMLGLKCFSIVFNSILAGFILLVLYSNIKLVLISSQIGWIIIFLAAIINLIFILFVTKRKLKIVSEAYAERLLEYAEGLKPKANNFMGI